MAGEENPFIDDKIWIAFLENCERRLENVIKKEAAL